MRSSAVSRVRWLAHPLGNEAGERVVRVVERGHRRLDVIEGLGCVKV